MSRHARGLRRRTGGRARVGRQAPAAGGERRPAAGLNRGLGRRRASQNRDVTLGAWLTRTDGRTGGRVQSIPPQSGVTACWSNNWLIDWVWTLRQVTSCLRGLDATLSTWSSIWLTSRCRKRQAADRCPPSTPGAACGRSARPTASGSGSMTINFRARSSPRYVRSRSNSTHTIWDHSHTVLPDTRQRWESRLYPQAKKVLDLATPEGCKAKLTYVTS